MKALLITVRNIPTTWEKVVSANSTKYLLGKLKVTSIEEYLSDYDKRKKQMGEEVYKYLRDNNSSVPIFKRKPAGGIPIYVALCLGYDYDHWRFKKWKQDYVANLVEDMLCDINAEEEVEVYIMAHDSDIDSHNTSSGIYPSERLEGELAAKEYHVSVFRHEDTCRQYTEVVKRLIEAENIEESELDVLLARYFY